MWLSHSQTPQEAEPIWPPGMQCKPGLSSLSCWNEGDLLWVTMENLPQRKQSVSAAVCFASPPLDNVRNRGLGWVWLLPMKSWNEQGAFYHLGGTGWRKAGAAAHLFPLTPQKHFPRTWGLLSAQIFFEIRRFSWLAWLMHTSFCKQFWLLTTISHITSLQLPSFPKYCLQLGQEEVASNTNLKFGGFYVSHTWNPPVAWLTSLLKVNKSQGPHCSQCRHVLQDPHHLAAMLCVAKCQIQPLRLLAALSLLQWST